MSEPSIIHASEAGAPNNRSTPESAPTGEALTDEREAFETWADDQGYPLARLDIGDGDDYHDLRTQGAWETWKVRAALSTHPPAVQPVAPAVPEAILSALRFYANGTHMNLADKDAWDTVSGEPPNFWCDEAGTATIEDGSIAAMALRGVAIDWTDDGDEAPEPIDGEAPWLIAATPSAEAQPTPKEI